MSKLNPRLLYLPLLVLLLFLLTSLYQVNFTNAQNMADSASPLFAIKTNDSTLTNPALDARSLLDIYRATETDSSLNIAGISQTSPINPEWAGNLAQSDVMGMPLTVASSRLPQGLLTGQRPIPLNTTLPKRNTPNKIEAGCQSFTVNPSLDYGTAWYSYADKVYIRDDAYFTWPNSLNMYEDNDGIINGNTGTDLDAFGQSFYFPSGANSMWFEYKIGYGSWSSGDLVYIEFYEQNPDGTLGTFLAQGTAPKYVDNLWHTESFAVNAGPVINALKGKNVVLTFAMVGDGSGESYPMDAYIDDIDVALCPSDTVPTGTITGAVFQAGSLDSLQDALAVLTYESASSSTLQVADITYPTSTGNYTFEHVDGLTSTGDQYQVWFLNDGWNPNRLGFWIGPPVKSFNDGQNIAVSSFDIQDVSLTEPAHDTEVTLPTTFRWDSRNVSSDRYYLCIYDVQTLAEVCTVNALTDNNVTVAEADLKSVPGFDFEYGRAYGWYLIIVGPDYDGSETAHIGFTFWANVVTFVTNTALPPGNPPPPGGNPPSAAGGADWTVMIYMAGDNDLGDPERYSNPSANLQGQFALLKQLAKDYPNLNIVTLTDFYDNSGTQFCHLKANGTQDCQQLGELNTADPAVLADFINDSLSSFSANYTMLIISDHGHAISGVAYDETTHRATGEEAQMTPNEIRHAYEMTSLATNKLDILFYNACLMGSFEAAYDAAPYADYMVASANELWVFNIYDYLLPLLADPAIKDNPEVVAKGMVDAYKNGVDDIVPGYFVSSAAYDLSKIAGINSALSNLGSVMSNDLAVSREAMQSVRESVQLYDSSGNALLGNEDAFVDLWHLATQLKNQFGTAPIGVAAQSLLNAIGSPGGNSSIIIATHQVSGNNGDNGTINLGNAEGLSIYFPDGGSSGHQPTFTNNYLNKGFYQEYTDNTTWDEFVREYASGNVTQAPNRVALGTLPVSGALPAKGGNLFLPMIIK